MLSSWGNTKHESYDNNFPSDPSDEEDFTFATSDGPFGWGKRQVAWLKTNRWPALACVVVAGIFIMFGSMAVYSLVFRTGSSANTQEENHEWLTEFFARYWEAKLQREPEYATFVGDSRYNDRLTDVSLQGFHKWNEKQKAFLAELKSFVSANGDEHSLLPEDSVNAQLLEDILDKSIRHFELKAHLMPITQFKGIQLDFPFTVDVTPFNSNKDYEHYIRRLRSLPLYVNNTIHLMKEGLLLGITQPKIVMQAAQKQVAGIYNVAPVDSFLYVPFLSLKEGDEGERALKAEGLKAVTEEALPSYRRLGLFIEEEYLPKTRDNIAATSMPNGEAYYNLMIEYFTTLSDQTCQGIHQIGMEEVARIRQEMESIVSETHFASIKEFITFLKTNDSFYAKTEEEYLQFVRAVAQEAYAALPLLFGHFTRCPFGVRPVPANSAPSSSNAYYQLPSDDCKRPGFVYVNTYDLPSRPLYSIKATTLHEAVPGHHMQLALQQEMQNVPQFRKHGEWTAYVEGWALYSESLGTEIGFYKDHYYRFGRLGNEMFRACRLVVDTGMHGLNWTRDQAIDFMLDNTPLSRLDIVSEVDRYISWPGQALAYKMGELKIKQLRERAKSSLGENFDIIKFHDKILSFGAIPLQILDTLMHQQFETSSASSPSSQT